MALEKLSGKLALITGANKGMGYQIALALAYRNCRVIMADKDCQAESRDKIISETCNENVRATYLDLASFKSTRSFVDELKQREERLDILINNAGVFCTEKEKTCDGLDSVVQVNHLGPFLLTNLLVELLKRSGEGRIIFVASSGAFFHNLSLSTMTEPSRISPSILSVVLNYYNSKLCNMIASKMFAERLKQHNITCNCTHPGMTNTDFLVRAIGDGYVDRCFEYLAKGVLKISTGDVKDAADSLVFLATSGSVKTVSGKYFVNYQEHCCPKVLEDEGFCRSIWEESARLVGIKCDQI